MTDNKNESKGGDIYVTINNDNKVIDICKSTAGEDGFRTFIDRNVKRVMNKGIVPNA